MLEQSLSVVAVTRGEMVESRHLGTIAVADTAGGMLASLGDAGRVVYARSAAKLLQVIPLVAAGAAERYGFTDSELAVACASHNGESEHIEAVSSLLGKLGLDAAKLQCGPHAPYHAPSAEQILRRGERFTSLHNNCSGKHSAMLALALHRGDSLETYMEPAHPVQQLMLGVVSELSGVPADEIPLGVDGCGVPVFGMPLLTLAAAYARLGEPSGLAPITASACSRVLGAIRAHPSLLAGNDRFDTALIRATSGRIVGKMGAEGVFAACLPERGLGLAVKIDDGSLRALYPVVVEALRQLDWLTAAELELLAPFHKPPVRNWRGDIVGAVIPEFDVKLHR